MTSPTLTFGESVALRVAAADQQHTMGRLAALGCLPAPGPHPWFRGLGEEVLRRLADRTASPCPHFRRGRLAPMYAVLARPRMHVQCRSCFMVRKPLNPVDDLTCDRCAVYARGLVSGALPIGPLLLIFGVCRPCGTELGTLREESS